MKPKFYCALPNFRQNYQALYDENRDHMSIQNLRNQFPTSEAMQTYFYEQDCTLSNRCTEMRTNWARQNNTFKIG